MTNKEISELLIDKFNQNRYQKALEFPNNKINVISLRENPLKLRILILDNDREFHLIIDEEKKEIFHDCPRFLIKRDPNDKICPHVIKAFLIVDQQISRNILNSLEDYVLTSEDFNSKKKSESFLKLANMCFESNNDVDGLNYLNKVIINQRDCESYIERYMITAIEKNLFIEFFDFLRHGYENELGAYFNPLKDRIREGFRMFMKSISLYSFFNLLRIMESIDKIIKHYEFQDEEFLSNLIFKLKKFIDSRNFNERYFAFFFLMKNKEKIQQFNPNLDISISLEKLCDFNQEILDYFLDQIESFGTLEKLTLIKNHLSVFEISDELYVNQYNKYKKEIKELERKVYLKKFAYLKLLLEKHNVKKSKVDFRKQRNTYIITHDQTNLQNPAYKYIITHIGFVGLNNSKIKSSEIGINYLLMKELFSDDLTNFPDIFYYHKQFWGDKNHYEINPIEGYSLMAKALDYSYDIEKISIDIENSLLIEWDLASKPRQASIVNAYGSQIIIPDQNNPLFHDLKPFDLCYCRKVPVKIESNLIKSVNVLKKCSFYDAIISVSKGMEFIEGYYPLSLVKLVVDKKINPFEAYETLNENPNKNFVPNFEHFIDAFKDFLFSYINKEKEYIFEQIISSETDEVNKFLILLNLKTELIGMDLPYRSIIKDLLNRDVHYSEFKDQFLTEVHKKVQDIIRHKKIGNTTVFNLKKMRHTPFVKYITKINYIRKQEFENSAINAIIQDKKRLYDISEITRTYYGKELAQILKIQQDLITREQLNKFEHYCSKLNLKLKIQDLEV